MTIRAALNQLAEALGATPKSKTIREAIDEIADVIATTLELPSVSAADNGKALMVSDGTWTASTIVPYDLPTVSAADNGKILMVVNGDWVLLDAASFIQDSSAT